VPNKNNRTKHTMYNLHLSEEQLAIREAVRDFVAGEVAAEAIKPERLEPFDVPPPADLIAAAGELGLRALALPEADGGADADTLTRCLVAEELAAGDTGLATVLMETAVAADLLFNGLASDEQRARFAPDFVADNEFHLALAGQEGADSALGADYHRARAAEPPATTATADGDEVVLDGSKVRISNAPSAKLFIVTAAGASGTEAYLVPADTPGLTVTEVPRDRGWYHGTMGDVSLSGCRVPAANRIDLGNRDPATLIRGSALADTPEGQAINLGVARAAFDAALDYAKIRIAGDGGRPLVEHQAIGEKLANVAGSLELVRGAIWRAAWDADNPEGRADGSLADLPHTLVSQVAAADMLYRAARDSAECFGAMGVMRDMPLQKYIHDTRVFRHSGAGGDDARLRLAEALSGFEPGRA
jgi:alkylation response protein AidB-like acyl-CoA dehydrogenase